MRVKLTQIFSVIIFSFSAVCAFAQPQDNSPFSRYGIGNLSPGYFAPLGAMAGISPAYNSPYNLNPENPASYATLDYTAFEVGLYYKYTSLVSANSEIGSHKTHNGNLAYLALGFPIFNPLNRATLKRDKPFDWGMSLGLIPFSQVAYDIQVDTDVPEIGNTTFIYRGDGQLYRLYYGNGFKYKGFSAGLNLGFLFGNISRSRLVIFNEIENALVDNLSDDTNHSGFNWDAGVQYEYVFNKLEDEAEERKRRYKTRLIVGLTGNGTQKVRTNTEINFQRGGAGYGVDTISYSEDLKGKSRFPAKIALGVNYRKDFKWDIGASYTWTNWSAFEHPNLAAPLNDTWRLSVGSQYIPNANSFKNYFTRVRYRAGMFYQKDPRVVGSEQLNSYGFTVGMGLPVRFSTRGNPSFINLSLEGGRLGDPDLIMENYIKVTMGFTFNDNTWFFKRQYR